MLDMLSAHRVDTTDLPPHLAQLVIAAEAAANAFRELDYAASLLRELPAAERMPIESAAVALWNAWQDIERRGGTMVNAYRLQADTSRSWWDGEKWVTLTGIDTAAFDELHPHGI